MCLPILFLVVRLGFDDFYEKIRKIFRSVMGRDVENESMLRIYLNAVFQSTKIRGEDKKKKLARMLVEVEKIPYNKALEVIEKAFEGTIFV